MIIYFTDVSLLQFPEETCVDENDRDADCRQLAQIRVQTLIFIANVSFFTEKLVTI